jgi:hypothetical protein
MIQEIDYYHIEIPDNPGAAFRILSGLKKAGVNLLACCGFPLGGGKVQIDLVPEHYESLRKAAARLDLQLSECKRAFLIQADRAVAVADTFEKFAVHSVNIVAHQAVSTGTGHWGMILWSSRTITSEPARSSDSDSSTCFTVSPEAYSCHGRDRIALNPHRRHT